MSKRFLAAAVFLAVIPLNTVAAPAPDNNRIPVQAELIKGVEAGRTKDGDAILAKVDIEWKNPRCDLRKGAILKGRMVSQTARSKGSRISELALVFDSAECGGRDLKPLPLTIAAVIAPEHDQNSSLYKDEEYQPLSEAVGLGLGGGSPAGTGAGFVGGPNAGGDGLRSVVAAATTVFVEPTRRKPPKAVLPGQVIGIGGVKLSVGSGPEGSSVLSSSSHNLRLDAGLQFVLVPSLRTVSTSLIVPAGSARTTSSPAAPTVYVPSALQSSEPPLDDTEICSPPKCSIALTTSGPETGTAQEAGAISVRDLGYAHRGDREMDGFDYDTALAYLGAGKLLFTFNPHLLVSRPATETAQIRTIRAVLIDLHTMKIQETMDWRVLDSNQYLWPLGEGKILAHVGNELREYGPAMRIEQRVSLDGPLSFVRICPSGKYLAVGVVHERHTRDLHEQLAEAESREPEEDVEVKVLNGDFRTLARVVRSSRDSPPVLSDDGEISIPTIGKNRWRIVENTWDQQRRVLAQVTSACRPEATTMQPDLLFLVGCDRQSDGKWYRMLRSDGKPVLKGWSPSAEFAQTADGVTGAFAVGVAKAAKPIAPDSVFRPSEIESESIAIYQVENGQRKFEVRVVSPIASHQTFALSPAGDQLAVLRGQDIALYAVPRH